LGGKEFLKLRLYFAIELLKILAAVPDHWRTHGAKCSLANFNWAGNMQLH
jgi:hypothetical protein